MRACVKWWSLVGCMGCMGCWVLGFALAPPAAFGEAPLTLGDTAGSARENPLVMRDGEWLVGGQSAQEVEEVRRTSPEADVARQISQTAYEGLSAGQVDGLAGRMFPAIVRDPAGGPPPLRAGSRVTGYPTDHAESVELGEGKHMVIQSLEPLAVGTSPSHRRPIDLSLTEAGRAFEPKTSAVGVRIPKRLRDGVKLSGSDVSLTPVDEQGRLLGGSEGTVDGSVVSYAGTQTDVSTLVKPTATGFSEDALLLSERSPERLFYRVGLPAGGRLVRAKGDPGEVNIVDGGVVVAKVSAPTAQDAEGTLVPVGVAVSGDILSLTVKHGAGRYRMPIEVDPTVEETAGGTHEVLFERTWGFYDADAPSEFTGGRYYLAPGETWQGGPEYGVEDIVSSSVGAGQYAFFYYRTQGQSRIYAVTAGTKYEGFAGNHFENLLYILNVHNGKVEEKHSWLESYGWENTTVCALSGCATGKVEHGVNDESEVYYEQYAREAGPYAAGTSRMKQATVDILQESGPSASFDTSDATINGVPNPLYSGTWINTTRSESVLLNAFDPGLGINQATWYSPTYPSWSPNTYNPAYGCSGVQCEECYEKRCNGGLPASVSNGGLPEGEDAIEATVKDPVGMSATAKGTIKVDNAAPYNIKLSGLPPWNEIGFGHYKFTVSATDGSGSTPSSGVASITVAIDGKEIGKPSGSCPRGMCTATGEWTVNGEEYAAGKHTIVMTATDGDGNIATEEATLTIHSAASRSAGPGSVELASGAFTLGTTDVAISSPGGGLSVERSFQSRRVTAGAEGPLGPQWQGVSLGGNESLTKLPTGSVVLTSSNGQQSLFTKEGSKFVAPTGDSNLTFTEESVSKFTLTDQHRDVTTFTVPEGGSGTLLTPYSLEVPGQAGKTKYTFETAAGITRPTEALAPVPVGVSCTTLVRGCRALTFSYASSTTATGEGPSEWGEYKGRLSKVSFTAYNPSSKAMQTIAVAQYVFDKQGRLRAEWDPRISPALKTIYGYDSENRIVAVTYPGQQPWLLHYGTIEGDATGGRLLSVTRPSASTAFGEDIPPTSTEAPKLSTSSPVEGIEVTVSTGGWTRSPLSYGYQWEDCSSSGEGCTPIAGATNPAYTVRYSDERHTLVALVTAINAGGAVTSATAASAVVPENTFPPTYSSSFGSSGSEGGKFKAPSYIAFGEYRGEPRLYVTDTGNNRVEEFGTSGEYRGSFGSSELKEPTGIAAALKGYEEGYVWVADSGNKRVQWYILGDAPYRSVSSEGPGALGGMTTGSYYQYVANRGESKIERFWTILETFAHTGHFGSLGTENGQLKEPSDIAWNPFNERLYVTDTGNNRVEYFKKGGEYVGKFGEAGSGSGQFKEPKGVVVDGLGDVWVIDSGNNRVEGFSSTGQYLTQFGSKGSGAGQVTGPVGIAVDPSNNVYVVDSGNNRIEKWLAGKRPANPPLPPATPPSPGTSSVTTFEYHVPVSGSGAPYSLGASETAGWAQKDNPVEATAVFPPDEAMGWPAKDYKRATVYYRDGRDRTVNIAAPSGGISTSEYNPTDDVVRTLGPDNRQAALKEGSKSAEVSQELDTQSTYSEEGSELLSTLGPQHTVKLANGSEVQARSHTIYHYDEGAPSEGGPYQLVTKVTQGAQVVGAEEEADVHTTITSYSGQSNLGWKLRKPTSVTIDPTGLDLTHTTEYDPTTGNVVETKAPGGTAESVYPPTPAGSFGSAGSGNGQFNHPGGVAVDSGGNVWVADQTNNRVEKLSGVGGFIASYGSSGAGAGQFSEPSAIAISQSTGNVYVSDTNNNRIDELSSSGAFVQTMGWGVSNGKTEFEICTSSCKAGLAGSGAGQLHEPRGLTVDLHGNIWIADWGNHRVVELSTSGGYAGEFASKGPGHGQLVEPTGVAISEGELYVSDFGNNRVEEFSTSGAYLSQFGTLGSGEGQLKEPQGISANPTTGVLYVSDAGNERVEEFTPAGKYLAEFGTYGTGSGRFHYPAGIGISSTGELYIADVYNARIDEWQLPGAGGTHMRYSDQFGSSGSGNGQFSYPEGLAIDGLGDVWVTDYYQSRIQKFMPDGKFIASYGSYGTGEGQFEHPTGIAINQGASDVYVANCESDRIEELSLSGSYIRAFGSPGTEPGQLNCPEGVALDSSGDVWVADSHNNRIEEFSATGSFIASYGSAGSGNGQFKGPTGLAFSAGNIYVVDTGNERVQELSSKGSYIAQFGSEGKSGGQVKAPEGIASDATGNLYVSDGGNNRIEEFSSSGLYLATFSSYGSGEGQMHEPQGLAIAPAGNIYIADALNHRIDVWMTNLQAVHDTKTIYYTTASNSEYPACGGHAEWAGLACQTQPAAQPEDTNLPKLPTGTGTYNIWEEPETLTSTSGTSTRTATILYDSAGRMLSKETTSTSGTALPKASYEYNTETGALIKQHATVEGKEQAITSILNSLGQITSYTDADGNISTAKYDVDGRPTEANDGKGIQTYSYDATTGALTKLTDSAASTFTAGYDAEGNMTSQGYPNGMTATYTHNQAGETTGVEYEKTTHCSSSCTWFKDAAVPSIHGQWISQTSSLAAENYTEDNAGRLTQVQETPAGSGCVTRIYAYDEETNRRSLTTREPGSKGECATEGGTAERHTYDEADRLTDEGTTYDTFGDITALPSTDAGSHELKSTYYVDGQTASLTQNGQTISYQLDPAGRTRETIATGSISQNIIQHYAGEGSTPVWMKNTTNSTTTRYIHNIGGELAAIQTNSETPTLQLTDLQGNIIATAALSETEPKLLTSERSTEYGVPTTTSPPKYSWLGGNQEPTELPSGVIAMGARTYVPQIGRFLQTDPQPGGSANAYAYTYGNPINETDPTGEYTLGAPSAVGIHTAEQLAAEGAAEQAALNAAAKAEAERKAAEQAAAVAAAEALNSGATGPAGPELPLGGYVGWAEEYGLETGQLEGGYSGGDPIAVAAAPCRHEDNPNANRCSASGYAVVTKTSKGSSCMVHFDGIVSSCQSVLERAKRQYEADNRTAQEWSDIIKCAIKRGMCPDG